MKTVFCALILVGGTLIGGAATAKDIPDGGLTMDETVAWLKDGGFGADVQTNKDGTKSIHVSGEGEDFYVYMEDCKEDRCGSLELSAGFDTKGAFTADKINDFTSSNRWVRAYVDKTHDPWVEYDVDLTPGGTFELLHDQVGIWLQGLQDFRKFIGW
jgi:hypothetical protein